MAYAFDRVDKLLNRENKRTSESDNLTSSNPMSASSPGGSLSGLSSSRPSSTNRQGRNRFSKQSSASAASEAFKGKVQLPGIIGNIGSDLKSRRKDIETKAKEYGERERGLTDSTYDIGESQADRAIEGNSSDFSRINDVLRKSRGRDIKRPEFETPVVPNSKYLSSDTGLKDLYRKESRPTYTPGMAEFDLSLIKSQPNMSGKIGKIVGEQNKLIKDTKNLFGTEYDKSLKYESDKLKSTKDYLNKYISDSGSELTKDQKKEASRLTEELDDLYSGSNEEIDRKIEDFMNYRDTLEGSSDLSEDVLDEVFRNWDDISEDERYRLADKIIDKYNLEEGKEFKPGEVFDKDEAKRFNNILDLLNKGSLDGVSRAEASEPISLEGSDYDPSIKDRRAREEARRVLRDVESRYREKEKENSRINKELEYSPLLWRSDLGRGTDKYTKYFNDIMKDSLGPEGANNLKGGLIDSYEKLKKSGLTERRIKDLMMEKVITSPKVEEEVNEYFKRTGHKSMSAALKNLSDEAIYDLAISNMLSDSLDGIESGPRGKELSDILSSSIKSGGSSKKDSRYYNELKNYTGYNPILGNKWLGSDLAKNKRFKDLLRQNIGYIK